MFVVSGAVIIIIVIVKLPLCNVALYGGCLPGAGN